MITREYTFNEDDFPIESQKILSIINLNPEIRNGVFFDIETTGFSGHKNALYLIGCCWFENNQWKLVQWLAVNTSEAEQKLIIEQFFKCISNFNTLISYNGHTFDLPFIAKKCTLLNLEYQISSWKHIDLYVEFRPLKSVLNLENLKLKTIEKFLGIFREDLYSGGALIPIYETYTKTLSPQLLELLLLHNYEDIKDMLFVLPLYAYIHLTQDVFSILSTDFSSDEQKFTVELESKIPLPEPVTYEYQIPINSDYDNVSLSLQINIKNDHITLILPVFTGTLKHFYNNPKDYYYLPMEDYAIHKSVAEYVDKDSKKKATIHNCYIKKEGIYIPQKPGLYKPSFKFNYNDIFEWIGYNDSMINTESFHCYIQSILKYLLLGIFN